MNVHKWNVRVEWRMRTCAMCAEQCTHAHEVHVCNALCLVCMCARLCAPALHLSTLVSVGTAHSIHAVCVWNLKVHVEIPIRKMCILIIQVHVASNSYTVSEHVQGMNRLRKHSNTVLWMDSDINYACTQHVYFANWAHKMLWHHKYTLCMHVEWRPIGGQRCTTSADQVLTKCISRCRRSQRPSNCLVFSLVRSVICTWSTPGLHLCPPIGRYVTCIYSS